MIAKAIFSPEEKRNERSRSAVEEKRQESTISNKNYNKVEDRKRKERRKINKSW